MRANADVKTFIFFRTNEYAEAISMLYYALDLRDEERKEKL